MKFVRAALIVCYITLLVMPVVIFLAPRWQLVLSAGRDLPGIIYPLFGLLAFTLVALQVIIGPNIRWLRRLFPKLYSLHRYQGVFALVFALLHPLLLAFTVGPYDAYISRSYMPESLRPYVTLGIIAFDLMLITVLSAVAAWKLARLKRVWRVLHSLNYLVFAFAWLHSWQIGSDIQTTALRYVWLLYLALGIGSLAARLFVPGLIGRASPKTDAVVSDTP